MSRKPERVYDATKRQYYFRWTIEDTASIFNSRWTAVETEPIFERTKDYVDELETENAKLRELVCGLNWCTESPVGPRVDCEHCPLGAVEGKPYELTCENMMRELGVEE